MESKKILSGQLPFIMTYRPLTVESALDAERQAREKGFDELADVFKNIADTLARVNETHRVTVEEARQNMGEDAFWKAVRKNKTDADS